MPLSELRPRWLWWAGFLAIGLLAAYLFLTVVTQTRIDQPIRGDARDYVAYAYNIQAHSIYSREFPISGAPLPKPDALRAPGYPVFLATFMTSAGAFDGAGVLLAQAVLGVATVLVYLLLFRRFLRQEWALLAGLLTAISPHLVNASVYFLSETLFTFLLGTHLLALEHALRRRQLAAGLCAGFFLALSLLVRPTTQYLFVAYAGFLLYWWRGVWRTHIKLLLCLLLPAILVTAAWSTRNWVEIGRVSDPSLTANFLQHGMYVNMMFEDRPETYGYPYRFDPNSEKLAGRTDLVLQAIQAQFEAAPGRYMSWFLFGKPKQFFAWNLTESIGDAFIYAPKYSPYFDKPLFAYTRTLAEWLHPWLMTLAFLGMFIALRGGQASGAAGILGVVMLYFVAFHMAGAPFPRYSIPLRPACFGLACFALQYLIDMLATRCQKSA